MILNCQKKALTFWSELYLPGMKRDTNGANGCKPLQRVKMFRHTLKSMVKMVVVAAHTKGFLALVVNCKINLVSDLLHPYVKTALECLLKYSHKTCQDSSCLYKLHFLLVWDGNKLHHL